MIVFLILFDENKIHNKENATENFEQYFRVYYGCKKNRLFYFPNRLVE